MHLLHRWRKLTAFGLLVFVIPFLQLLFGAYTAGLNAGYVSSSSISQIGSTREIVLTIENQFFPEYEACVSYQQGKLERVNSPSIDRVIRRGIHAPINFHFVITPSSPNK